MQSCISSSRIADTLTLEKNRCFKRHRAVIVASLKLCNKSLGRDLQKLSKFECHENESKPVNFRLVKSNQKRERSDFNVSMHMVGSQAWPPVRKKTQAFLNWQLGSFPRAFLFW